MAHPLLKQAQDACADYARENNNASVALAIINPIEVFEMFEFMNDYKVPSGLKRYKSGKNKGELNKDDEGNPQIEYEYPFVKYFTTEKTRRDGKGVEMANYKSAVDNAISRYKKLLNINADEQAEDYRQFQDAELEILQGYVLNVFLDVAKQCPTIVDDVAKKKAEQEKANNGKDSKAIKAEELELAQELDAKALAKQAKETAEK